RYYQPDAGRWLSADPGGLVDGVNLYQFCGNNPGIFMDTNGCMYESADSVLDIVKMYANPVIELNSFDSLSRELTTGYSKNEKTFILKFILGENLSTISNLSPEGYYTYLKDIAGDSLA
ncbi:RHS repeat-associated core domain-containing protein, partial [Enterobacter cloacae]|uniref:RHS repeat-associated core domain-containing protein n=1 Tax=Enterobacter cloacae TaxID=550 RepID=UPI0023EE6880